MELVGAKVRVRPLLPNDLTVMAEWNQDSELQSFVDCDLPGNLQELERWYRSNVPDRHYQIFAIETQNGELIGDLELDHICWSKREAELRIRIGKREFWGKGYGGEAIRIILEHYIGEKGFSRIYLRVYDFNRRAIQCYLKNGFRQVGVLQRNRANWKNIILMEITEMKFRRIAQALQAV